MKIIVRDADSVRYLLQIAILECIEIKIKPLRHEYMDYNEKYEIEIAGETNENKGQAI